MSLEKRQIFLRQRPRHFSFGVARFSSSGNYEQRAIAIADADMSNAVVLKPRRDSSSVSSPRPLPILIARPEYTIPFWFNQSMRMEFDFKSAQGMIDNSSSACE
jgi:hypothetical protein